MPASPDPSSSRRRRRRILACGTSKGGERKEIKRGREDGKTGREGGKRGREGGKCSHLQRHGKPRRATWPVRGPVLALNTRWRNFTSPPRTTVRRDAGI